MPILSPAAMDGRPGVQAPTEICRHTDIVELRSGAPTLVTPCREDIAIAEVPDESKVTSWQGDANGYDTPNDVVDPQPGLRVKKFGRTTGLTHGIIEAETLRLHIPYDSEFFRSLVWFQGVWSIKSADSDPFALGGDSGSLIVTDDSKHAVGVLFATAARGARAFFVPMQRVQTSFAGFELVGNHGV
jgi:hypothetical protein